MYKERGGICKIIAATLMLVLSQCFSYAQPKSLGASFSLSGIALSYEHTLSDRESFVEISAKSEISGILTSEHVDTGLSGSVTWNVPIKKWKSLNGNRISFFAGPGVICGYGMDIKTSYGPFFGLKGRVGLECAFDRKVVISAAMSPAIGAHMEIRQDKHVTMKFYKKGLIYGVLPEIGIKYRF
jgi:hypothetical protein